MASREYDVGMIGIGVMGANLVLNIADLGKKLAGYDKAWDMPANRLFYLALPPSMIEPITEHLAEANLNEDRDRARIVVEKPFGHDLDSAKELDRVLTGLFDESQIFRIDHYLGKETVQNILAFRFGNTFFEPIWNRRYIDHVQITVAEKVGVEHRGGFGWTGHAGVRRRHRRELAHSPRPDLRWSGIPWNRARG